MGQSPWEANSHSTSQEIPLLLWNPKAHYHNSPPLVRILSHMSPLHTFTPYFLNIHSNIIFHLRPGLRSALPFRFSTKATFIIMKRFFCLKFLLLHHQILISQINVLTTPFLCPTYSRLGTIVAVVSRYGLLPRWSLSTLLEWIWIHSFLSHESSYWPRFSVEL
jgi:hypothetical protein